MNTNKEKFLNLVSKEETKTIERNKERIKNRKRLKESRAIAIKVLARLDELGWSQRKLAGEMDVTPQQITKIVKGKENLTLETQLKLQDILNIPILATFYEDAIEKIIASVKVSESTPYIPFVQDVSGESFSSKSTGIKMNYSAAKDKYEFERLSA